MAKSKEKKTIDKLQSLRSEIADDQSASARLIDILIEDLGGEPASSSPSASSAPETPANPAE